MKLSLFALFFSLSAIAAENPMTAASLATLANTPAMQVPAAATTNEPVVNTGFEELHDWFMMGLPVRFNDVRGFYSGRCFSAFQPNAARNGLLTFFERRMGDDWGPGFPPATEQKFLYMVGRGQPVDYFDYFPHAGANPQNVAEVARQSWFHLSVATEGDSLSVLSDIEPNGRWDFNTEIVQYRDFLVMRETNLIGQVLPDPWTGQQGYFNAGNVRSMCYFFKRVY